MRRTLQLFFKSYFSPLPNLSIGVCARSLTQTNSLERAVGVGMVDRKARGQDPENQHHHLTTGESQRGNVWAGFYVSPGSAPPLILTQIRSNEP